jgi:glycosyltransferase involved in cell wall biosynthesis
VIDKGRVPQQEGARLLQACDVVVSPHSSHMVDAKFFGSPTKLFEYMALGAGIVASDLEQIGAVLRPAIRPDHAQGAPVGAARAVLCTPGDVNEFVQGVNLLLRDADLSRALGGNAREAARTYYSWDQHVLDLWAFASGRPLGGMAADLKDKVGAA